MSPTLLGGHAEYLAGQLVEPGSSIPSGVDKETLSRLEADGRIAKSVKKSTPPKED